MNHYRDFWGKPKEVLVFDLKELSGSSTLIHVAEFSPESESEDWVYATIGAHNLVSNGGTSKESQVRKFEFFIYSRIQNQELAEFLAGLSIYPLLNKTFFSIGDTVRGDKPVFNGSGLSDVLLTYPYFEAKDFAIIHHDGTHISMVWIVPIFPSERQFLHTNSWDALENLFREKEIDTSDFFRKAVA